MPIDSPITASDQRAGRWVAAVSVILLTVAIVAGVLRYQAVKSFFHGSVHLTLDQPAPAELTEADAMRWAVQAIKHVSPACTVMTPARDERAAPDAYLLRTEGTRLEGMIAFACQSPEWPGPRMTHVWLKLGAVEVECSVDAPR